MSVRRSTGAALVGVAFLAVLAAPHPARACDVLRFDFMPTGNVQLAVWITDASGTFIDTVRVTRLTATFGLGNRPGIESTHPTGGFESNYHWPYGKRVEALPVWAYTRGVDYPMVVMQDGMEDWLGFHNSLSSDEPYFCKPQSLAESIDMTTCASEGFNSDKGMLDGSLTSPYPPRNDLTMFFAPDNADAELLAGLNDLDAVTLATPADGELVSLSYLSAGLTPGDYIAWIEVNLENDTNASWWGDSNPGGSSPLPCLHDDLYPGIGVCLHGQPSVVWNVPFTIGTDDTFAETTLAYVGYGSPTGAGGTVSPADGTITAGVDGSGAGRLLPMTGATGDFRFGVACDESFCPDTVAPGAVDSVAQVPPDETPAEDITEVTIRLLHTADDGGSPVNAYEIRYAEGVSALDAATFQNGIPGPLLQPGAPGAIGEVVLTGLRSGTTYTVGVRAADQCSNWSTPTFFEVTTDPLEFTTVTPCGCSTRAGGAGPAGAAGSFLVLVAAAGTAALLRRGRRRP